MSTFLVINKLLYKIYVVKLTAELPTTDSLTVWQCSLSAAASGTNTESFQRMFAKERQVRVSMCILGFTNLSLAAGKSTTSVPYIQECSALCKVYF